MGTLTAEQIANMQVTKNQIRCMISNVYDLQKLRISAGNRLVSSFYIQLGIEPSTSPDTAEKDERKLIDVLKTEYKRITDGVATNNYSVKKQIKLMRESKDDQLDYIRSEIDYKLVESYILLLRSEEESVKVLDKYVQAHPLWKEFFEPIKGCGTLMSAVCIAYLDIYKARHVSSFFRYCGLDTVQDVDKDGNALFLAVGNNFRKVRMKLCYTYACNGENYFGRIIHTGEFDSDGSEILTSDTGEILECTFAKQGDATVYEDIEIGDEYIGEVVVSQHGRRMGDTEMFEYTDKDGNKSMKRGITYNPIIKTKLMGVLTGCLLKAKDPTYSTIYYDCRARLDNSNHKKGYTDGHKNMIAQRYMIKQFLRNLWTTWRALEGLDISEPYEVAKLGHEPHHYNKYHTEMARKSMRG